MDRVRLALWLVPALVGFALVSACAPRLAAPTRASGELRVLAVETFLADMTQNVAGDRLRVEALMPTGLDPHAFEPTPQDVRRVSESDVLIVNGGGVEAFITKLLQNAGGSAQVVTASAGLASRPLAPGEANAGEGDPHFWLDPTRAVTYVENIRDALARADPAGATVYRANADVYITKLNALDAWIKLEVAAIPPGERKLVTDHDTFGYYADRYGFDVIGMLVPSTSTADSSTAQQLAALIDAIRASHVRAIFLENNSNPQLATQIARDTGARVVTGLFTHSLSEADGPAPTYLKMLEYDTRTIVDSLK